MSGKMVKTRCPACSSKYRVPPRNVGHRARCAKCKTTFRVVEIEESRRPTEEDVLRWLNEGMGEDELAPRPRVISGGGSAVEAEPATGPADDPSEPTLAPAAANRPPALRDGPTGPESAPLDKETFLRKTG